MTHLLDLSTRAFWRVVGRTLDLAGADAWLDAPISSSARVGAAWVEGEQQRHGGVRTEPGPDAGLMPSMEALRGSEFDPDALAPAVRDFYEHTSRWRMDVWSSWSPLFWPGGELVARFWGRRVEQLALPMRPLELAHGLDSQVTPITDASGAHVASAWIRTMRSSGRTVFSGAYMIRTLPGSTQPSVHVAFPLESGNVQVFLRPRATAAGGLLLESMPGEFGEDGTYVVVLGRQSHAHARRVPLHETFHVHLDADGVLRTDHFLRVGPLTALRLHYRMERLPQ